MGPEGDPVVVWSTQDPAASEVSFGQTNKLDTVARVAGERTDHRVRLPNIRPDRAYFYQVAAKHEVTTFRSGVRFTRGPYLQDVRASEATILWRSSGSGTAEIALARGDSTSVQPEQTRGRLRLTGLLPGERYRYRVSIDGVSSAEGRLETAGDDDNLTIALFGDSRNNPEIVERLSMAMSSHQPDIVLHSGDFVVDARKPQEWDPQFFNPAASLLQDAAVYPAIGNHEHDDRSYYDAFEVPGNGGSRAEAWYSIRRGPVHLTVLDTNPVSGLLEPGTEQLAWLERDLQQAEAPWKVVMFHHPLYSSGRHKSNQDLRSKLMPLFARHSVDLLLTGHDHCYERTWPLVDGKRDEDGIVHVVSGGGGAVLYPVGRSEWTAVSESTYHYCVLTVGPDHIGVDVRDLDDQEVDAFSIAKDERVVSMVSGVTSVPSAESLRALGRLADRRHIDVITKHVEASDTGLRRAAAEALSRISSPRTIDALTGLSKDEDTEVRRWATRGLAYIADPSSSPPLVERLGDEDADTRRFAAIGLRLVPLSSAVSGLVNLSEDTVDEVRTAAIQALRYQKSKAARAAIIGRLADDNASVRSMAVSAIVELGIAKQAVVPLASLLPSETNEEKIRILSLLSETKDVAAVDAMTAELSGQPTAVRRRAAIELGNLGSDRAVAALIDAMEDKDKGVRQFAWRALRVITKERHPADAGAWRTWYENR
jgi:HEAT repeat protein